MLPQDKGKQGACSCRSVTDEPGALPARAPWSAKEARERSAVARLRRRWNAHSGLSVMACLCKHMHLFRHTACSMRYTPYATGSQEGSSSEQAAPQQHLLDVDNVSNCDTCDLSPVMLRYVLQQLQGKQHLPGMRPTCEHGGTVCMHQGGHSRPGWRLCLRSVGMPTSRAACSDMLLRAGLSLEVSIGCPNS